MKKRMISLVLAIVMAVYLLPMAAFAGSGTVTVGPFTVTGGTLNKDYYYYPSSSNTLMIRTNTPLIISTVGDEPVAGIIAVDCQTQTANITLKSVNIDINKVFSGKSPLSVYSGSAIITLANNSTNTFKSGEGAAAMTNNGKTATLRCENAGTPGHSCDDSCGSLTAIGGESGSGIGNNIEIAGGNITATGGEGAAGIGGGSGGSGKNIIISGGTVEATGGSGRFSVSGMSGIGGAGIGGGAEGSGSNITISGGIVTATGGSGAAGKEGGAGIGGSAGNVGSNITISSGTVTATGGNYAAGIGGGNGGSGSNIAISDGVVTANGSTGGAGIGGGAKGTGDNITISGGTITATGSTGGAGIGGGVQGTGDNIAISGGRVTAIGGVHAAGIGGGLRAGGNNISISRGEIVATGGALGAGIGGGNGGGGSNITISGGVVTAKGGSGSSGGGRDGGGAGIGGGNNGNGSYIVVSGGTITANAGTGGAGIGGGDLGRGDDITISGGMITAIGSSGGAGISSGNNGGHSNITVSGGSIDVNFMFTVKGRVPTNEKKVEVFQYIIDASETDISTPVAVDEIFAAPSPGCVYGTNDMKIDGQNGKLNVYLPAGITEISVLAGGKSYTGSVSDDGSRKIVYLVETPILTTNLPDGVVGESYQQSLKTGIPTGDLFWEITKGSLPEGLSLNANGEISGTPIKEETTNFTVALKSTGVAEIFPEKAMAITIESKPTVAPADPPVQVGGIIYPFKPVNGVQGVSTIWIKGSVNSYTVAVDASIEKYTYSMVDMKKVPPDCIIVESGSTIVTLKPEYLNTLSLGTHTLRIAFSDGYAETSFTIGAGQNGSPQTGDSTNKILLVSLLFASGGTLTAAAVMRKRRRKMR